MKQVITEEAKTIYGIIETQVPQGEFDGMGLGGNRLTTISFNEIAAVVSKSTKDYTASRDNFLAHARAIEGVMNQTTVLPVRFATVARDEEKVKKILEVEYEKLKRLLDYMKGKKELGLKALFKAEQVYPDILEKNGEIKALKERVQQLPPEKRHLALIEIGEKVEAALERERENYKDAMIQFLEPSILELKINSNYGELMILNAAFLIWEEREKEFDQKIEELSNQYCGKIKLKYVGKVPPFNFTNLVIHAEDY